MLRTSRQRGFCGPGLGRLAAVAGGALSAPFRARALSAGLGLVGASTWLPDFAAHWRRAWAIEIDERRVFLWIPVAAMGGVGLNLSADREPALWLSALLLAGFSSVAFLARERPLPRAVFIALAALAAGFV